MRVILVFQGSEYVVEVQDCAAVRIAVHVAVVACAVVAACAVVGECVVVAGYTDAKYAVVVGLYVVVD